MKEYIPAFPCQEFNQGYCNSQLYEGMTLRDYFAGQALISYSSKSNRESMKNLAMEKDIPFTADMIDETIAKACYLMADAMLKERDK